jgi:hypothetical protein
MVTAITQATPARGRLVFVFVVRSAFRLMLRDHSCSGTWSAMRDGSHPGKELLSAQRLYRINHRCPPGRHVARCGRRGEQAHRHQRVCQRV